MKHLQIPISKHKLIVRVAYIFQVFIQYMSYYESWRVLSLSASPWGNMPLVIITCNDAF